MTQITGSRTSPVVQGEVRNYRGEVLATFDASGFFAEMSESSQHWFWGQWLAELHAQGWGRCPEALRLAERVQAVVQDAALGAALKAIRQSSLDAGYVAIDGAQALEWLLENDDDLLEMAGLELMEDAVAQSLERKLPPLLAAEEMACSFG